MAEQTMRGTRLGWISYERDDHVDTAERWYMSYTCANGHRFPIPFSTDAEEIPREWVCRCGSVGEADLPADASVGRLAPVDERPARHVRTHWDMLLERRTIAELEDLLAERLELLHSGAFAGRESA